LNPHFVTNIEVDYHFEEQQTFLLEAYDLDDEKQPENLSAQELIGTLEFQLHQVVTSRDQTLLMPLVNSKRKNNGRVRVTGEEKKMSQKTEIVLLKLKGRLANSGSSFFIVWKNLGPNQWKPVFKSEVKSSERGCQNWNQFKIDTQLLCNDDED
jgi:hypothetical protein